MEVLCRGLEKQYRGPCYVGAKRNNTLGRVMYYVGVQRYSTGEALCMGSEKQYKGPCYVGVQRYSTGEALCRGSEKQYKGPCYVGVKRNSTRPRATKDRVRQGFRETVQGNAFYRFRETVKWKCYVGV